MTRTLDEVAGEFRRIARDASGGYSPAYELIAGRVAADAELLAIAARAPEGRPAANMLLAATHFLALRDPGSTLGAEYARLGAGGTVAPGRLWPVFREFCLARREEMLALIRERRVQTNEAGRSALLLPALHHIATITGRPLFLVEIGSSAGLLLRLDAYSIAYVRDGREIGSHPGGLPHLECEVRGADDPPLPPGPLPIAGRVGTDLEPVDVHDPDDRLWLEALIWPGQPGRAQRLREALDAAAADPPDVRAGDALDLLPDLLDSVPLDVVPVVFHAWALNQLNASGRQRLEGILRSASDSRRLYRLGLESAEAGWSDVTLAEYAGGERGAVTTLAHAHSHGAWLEWVAD